MLVLDGGLATQLEARGHDLSSDLWSARLLADDPDAILDAHRAYFDAGAQVATTASYQASVDGLRAAGHDPERLVRRGVELARRARDETDTPGRRWVAGSVGPYGAALADGSEYRGDYDLPVAALRAWHRPRLAWLVEAGADVLALETIPCLAEVEALLAEVAGTGVPCWLSLTCVGAPEAAGDVARTRRGEPAAEAWAMAAEVPEVVAVGLNCTEPRGLDRLVALAATASGKPVVAYPNSGETWDAVRRTWTGAPSVGGVDATAWVAAGARSVGGCCRVGPGQIADIARTVTRDQGRSG